MQEETTSDPSTRKHATTAAGALTLALLAAAGAARAQTAPGVSSQQPLPQFEAASIKPANPGPMVRVGINVQPGERLNASNTTLSMLIQYAFDLKLSQIVGGPDWMDSTPWDITAAGPEDGPPLPSSANQAQTKLMLQSLLASRFGLTYHHETRQMDVLYLTVAKGGSKLVADDRVPAQPGAGGDRGAPPPPPPPSGGGSGPAITMNGRSMTLQPGTMMAGPGTIHALARPVSSLALMLSNFLHTTVIDHTGLTGNYDFNLQWTPEPGETGFTGRGGMGPGPDGAMGAPGPGAAANGDNSGPSIYSALEQQLGLKLASGKGPVDVFVIDAAAKPQAN